MSCSIRKESKVFNLSSVYLKGNVFALALQIFVVVMVLCPVVPHRDGRQCQHSTEPGFDVHDSCMWLQLVHRSNCLTSGSKLLVFEIELRYETERFF